MFNSTPTFPRRDFDGGCLLSLCFYDLLETPWLPTTPRPYGNGPLVLAQSDFTSCYVNLQEKKKTLPLSGTLHRSMYF